MAVVPVNPYFRSKSAEHDVTLTSFVAELWYSGLKILTQCVKLLEERVLQVWCWYLLLFRRYRKKTRGALEIASPVGRGLKRSLWIITTLSYEQKCLWCRHCPALPYRNQSNSFGDHRGGDMPPPNRMCGSPEPKGARRGELHLQYLKHIHSFERKTVILTSLPHVIWQTPPSWATCGYPWNTTKPLMYQVCSVHVEKIKCCRFSLVQFSICW